VQREVIEELLSQPLQEPDARPGRHPAPRARRRGRRRGGAPGPRGLRLEGQSERRARAKPAAARLAAAVRDYHRRRLAPRAAPRRRSRSGRERCSGAGVDARAPLQRSVHPNGPLPGPVRASSRAAASSLTWMVASAQAFNQCPPGSELASVRRSGLGWGSRCYLALAIPGALTNGVKLQLCSRAAPRRGQRDRHSHHCGATVPAARDNKKATAHPIIYIPTPLPQSPICDLDRLSCL
jgi:hypothetical protein